MSAIIATALAANNSASIKQQQCQKIINSFDNQIATIQQKQDYASCINYIYQQELSYNTIVVFKIMFVIALIGLAIGLYQGYKAHDGLLANVLLGVIGFIGLPVFVSFLVGILYGVYWLFN